MSIAVSEHYLWQSAVNFCNSQLSFLCQNAHAQKLPNELREKLTTLQKEFDSYCIDNTEKKPILIGNVFSADELLSIIKDCTSDDSWEFSETLKTNTTFYKNTFNIDFNDSQVVEHLFVRVSKSRDDIHIIGITCFPNKLCYTYCETDRADSVLSDEILNESEFKEALTQKFSEL